MVGSANLNIMIKAARKAGRGLVKDFREVENLQVSVKGAGDFVSRADLSAEKTLKDELMGARPTYGWLAEEGGEEEGQDPTRRWIVDPLDGTTNFLHGLPHWAVSIALEHKGQIVAGVVFDPAKDEMFFAEKGKGAFVNDGTRGGADRRLRPSQRDIFQDSLFSTGIPFLGRPGHAKFLKELHQVMGHSAGVRRMGSAALDLAWTAAGRYDGFWERGLAPWDIAAGVLIAREAGCEVESLSGGNVVETGDIICANAALMAPLKERVK